MVQDFQSHQFLPSRHGFGFITVIRISKIYILPRQGRIPERELIEARWVADMAIWVDLTDRIRVRAKAENLFDEVYVASIDPAGLRPGKPFEFLMGVEVSF